MARGIFASIFGSAIVAKRFKVWFTIGISVLFLLWFFFEGMSGLFLVEYAGWRPVMLVIGIVFLLFGIDYKRGS